MRFSSFVVADSLCFEWERPKFVCFCHSDKGSDNVYMCCLRNGRYALNTLLNPCLRLVIFFVVGASPEPEKTTVGLRSRRRRFKIVLVVLLGLNKLLTFIVTVKWSSFEWSMCEYMIYCEIGISFLISKRVFIHHKT